MADEGSRGGGAYVAHKEFRVKPLPQNLIIEEECKKQNISSMELKGGGKRRKVSDARARIAVRGRAELGLTAAAIARHVGVNASAITRAIDRVEKDLRR